MKHKPINKYKFYAFKESVYYWCYSKERTPEKALDKIKSAFKRNNMNPDGFEFINIK